MPLRSFPNFKLVMGRHRKKLRGALGSALTDGGKGASRPLAS